ncbi:hypothetical protein ABIB85_007973 [Bradyrhizobium sp. JR1.5]
MKLGCPVCFTAIVIPPRLCLRESQLTDYATSPLWEKVARSAG